MIGRDGYIPYEGVVCVVEYKFIDVFVLQLLFADKCFKDSCQEHGFHVILFCNLIFGPATVFGYSVCGIVYLFF